MSSSLLPSTPMRPPPSLSPSFPKLKHIFSKFLSRIVVLSEKKKDMSYQWNPRLRNLGLWMHYHPPPCIPHTHACFSFLLSESSRDHEHTHKEEEVKLLKRITYIITVQLLYVIKGCWKILFFRPLQWKLEARMKTGECFSVNILIR